MKAQKFLFAALVVFSGAAMAHAQTVDDIVTKHLAAIGGEANWKKVNALRMTGSLTAQGTQIGVVVTAEENKGARQDITVSGMSGYAFMTPTQGWTYMPFAGQQKPEAMTADQVKEAKDDLDIQGDLVDYRAKGSTVDYLGKEDYQGTECYKLKLTFKDGNDRTIFIDPTAYYKIREVKKQKADGKEVEVGTDFSNFQKLPEGIVVPMTVGTPNGDVTMSKFEVNPAIDESIFAAPAH